MSETDVPVPAPLPAAWRFGRFELNPALRQLACDGTPVKLGGRAFDTLVALLARHERVVAKRELMDAVWPRLVVEENNLQVQVLALRKLLGPAAIATVPGRGYRLTLAVEAVGATPPSAVAVVRSTRQRRPGPHTEQSRASSFCYSRQTALSGGSCPGRSHLCSGDLRLSSLRADGKRPGHPPPSSRLPSVF